MHWTEIPGWFQWRSGQEEAVRHFPAHSRFIEVGNYLGRSLCSLGEVVQQSGKRISVIGIDTCRGSGVEGPRNKDYHAEAVAAGGGTFAGTLHRNIIGAASPTTSPSSSPTPSPPRRSSTIARSTGSTSTPATTANTSPPTSAPGYRK